MEGEMEKCIIVWITAIACLCYCFYLVARIKGEVMRLLSLLPVFCLFTILPFILNSLHIGILTLFLLVWVGNFKLILFAFDQGPLTPLPPKLSHFICITFLPIKTEQQQQQIIPSHQNAKKAPKVNWKSVLLVLKALLLALIIRSYEYRPIMHPYLVLALYSVHLYLAVEIILALAAAPARACGFELEPQFNEPYLATSLQDFWGRRWNLMVTSILRPTVYTPVCRISTPIIGPRLAQLSGVVAAFLVSGLIHELIFYYITRVNPTWEVTSFFVLQGLCVGIEIEVKRALTDRWQLHRAISGPLTVVFVVLTCIWLFFPQLRRNGAFERLIQEYSIMIDFVRANLLFNKL
ncbi:probable long-chain-alcohol O-fatty-acyltransferase 5 [Corylus avellana]|uniref:probable long-chain-alcohol O-fatty-acyltransferase 5 n=1 Tax=Corylus avellana TaxID=13451 RepID=UPI00286AB593|nr:probable long-chain-alcohol O-fatty-acyltransferase 5 [Corylus avellana]